ncbi:MAG: SPOR domain-containing protein, partial [Deltaproteobacteria bacterium]|nr:SPOR domain-containing protein [Deltaproteobacteria bacterium]
VPPAKKVVPPPAPLPKPEVKEETPPPAAPRKAEEKAEPPAPSVSSETKIEEEPGRLPVPPKSEVKEELRPRPSGPTTIEKPEIREPVIPKEQAAAEAAPKKPVAAAPGEKVPPPKATPLPYSIYLGSYKDLQRVQKADSFYREIGLSPYWFPIDLGEKGTWYRVYAGCFTNREAAEALIKEKRISDASSKQTPHAALAGTYLSKEALEPAISRLTKLGYGPYVIRQPDGSSYLFVGAFFQKSQAVALVAELAGKGVESRPAER